MKKIINNVADIESEVLDGLVAANPERIKRLGTQNIIIRNELNKNKVAVVSAGGAGHEPAHAGYVGYGMLDCAIIGRVFHGPAPLVIFKGIDEVATEKGVLCVVKNYTIDMASFEAAMEMAKGKGINIDRVVVDDDVALSDNALGRRGVAGTVLIHKIAGAAAEIGMNLQEVKEFAQRAVDNTRTMGMAIKTCTIPETGQPRFEIPEMEMDLGIGIHGEPGIRREPITNANSIARKMLDKILTHVGYANHEIVLMINGMGATPLMELLIVNKFVHEYLFRSGVEIYDTMVGNFMTSLDMSGFSITLMKLDEELKKLYDSPTDTFAWKKQLQYISK